MFSPEEIENTRQLLELFGSNKLTQLTVSETGGYSVEIVASTVQSYAATPAMIPPSNQAFLGQQSAVQLKSSAVPAKSQHKSLNSPMVGIFYSAATPDDPPFVNVGDVVALGQTIGLIEAMKVFSEIPAELSGRIVEIVAVSGTLVQQSEPLFRIEAV